MVLGVNKYEAPIAVGTHKSCRHERQREMSTATEQIRISETVKHELERRQRADESFNDVLERLLAEERDLFAGFGAFEGTDRGETIRRIHEGGTHESRERIDHIAENRGDE